jgi:hypothetical protein
MLADPELLADLQGDVGFTEKKPVFGNLIHLADHLKRRGVLLSQKVHQSGEGLIPGLNPVCSQKKRQQAEKKYYHGYFRSQFKYSSKTSGPPRPGRA